MLQDVEVLAFVFVNAFDVDVEERLRIDGGAAGAPDVVGEAILGRIWLAGF